MTDPLIKSAVFGANCEKARRSFYHFCTLAVPTFYTPNKTYLKELCDTLQRFYESDTRAMIINAPPRHGKSLTAQLFCCWILGNDNMQKIISGSYNETLSTLFAKGVRNRIQERKADTFKPVYSDIFAGTEIKRGDASMNLWSLKTAPTTSYLATSPGGTSTGMGGDIIIIDDIIRNAMEAYNENILEGHFDWFANTLLSRLEKGGKFLFIMTRWATNDMAGRALRHFKKLGMPVEHINYVAKDVNGVMLCDDILNEEDYDLKMATMDRAIFSANYQQEPVDLEGRLYQRFQTYDGVRPLFKTIGNYTDTADTGSDYLASINYGVTFDGQAYILDVLYTDGPMEDTEPATAQLIAKDGVQVADIESNNGGRGFGRNVERILLENGYRCRINPFWQGKNKEARILTNATFIMDNMFFPVDWMNKWPDFYDSMATYQRKGKNSHDDAQDALTGIAEKLNRPKYISF